MGRDVFDGSQDALGGSSDPATKGYVDSAIIANGSSGRELAYVEQASTLSSQGNTTYATGMSLTIPDFVVGARPVYVNVMADIQFPGTQAILLAITTANHAAVFAEKQFFTTSSFGELLCGFRKRITAAGTYSGYELHAKIGGAATYTLLASTGMPAASALVEEK